MKLFLASEAKHPTSMKLLDEYVGGFKGKKIAYIPTASNGESFGTVPWGRWKKGGTWKTMNSVGADIDLILLEDYLNTGFPERLMDKDIIFMSGGVCGYLMYWIRRTKLDKYLPEILNNGTTYVGTSAGSVVVSERIDSSEWEFSDAEAGASLLPGLGLVNFDIYPHYEEALYEKIKKRYKGDKMYLLKTGEAIIVEDGEVVVKGEERVISQK